MNITKRLILGTAILLAASAAWASESGDPLDESAIRRACSEAHFSEVDYSQCLVAKAKESEKSLQQAEQSMLAALSQWDEDDRYRAAAKAAFARSSSEFALYRKQQCQFAAALGGGTDAAEKMRQACIAELNLRRADQLMKAQAQLPRG